MNDHESLSSTDSLTLDPPGSIVVIGAGPLGIEAALYGRFLGYDIRLLEAFEVGASMIDQCDQPLPMLPDRCLSPLAISALRAQRTAGSGVLTKSADPESDQLPTTIGDWINNGLKPLTETDLLKDRLLAPARVTDITTVAVEPEEPDEDTSDIPPDFRVRFINGDGGASQVDAEAVIVAIGAENSPEIDRITFGFERPMPYFFTMGGGSGGDAESHLREGHRQITEIYAQLVGRADLDLYRPRRS